MNKLSTLGGYTLLCIASLTIMVGALVAPGLVNISTQLGVGDNAILLVTLPALGAVIFAPLAGKMIDKYGAYNAIVIGMFLYGLLGASVYWLHGPSFVFANRILLGGLTAVVMAACTVLISQWYFGRERLVMVAKQGMAIELGGVVFLFSGGILATKHWALPLSLYLVAWVFLVMLLLFVPRNSGSSDNQANIESEEKIITTGLSLKSVYTFAMLSMSAFFTTFVLLPITMNTSGYDEEQVGTLLAFISLVAVITAHFMPKIIKHLGEQKVLGLTFIAYSTAYLFYLQNGLALLTIGAVFSGIGFGLSIPLLNHMTVERSPYNVRGRNLSYFTMAVFCGQFLTSFTQSLPGDSETVFQYCIFFCAIIGCGLLVKSHNFQKPLENRQ